ERREEELREAYRKARTPEEASAILQCYAQRFSISEAVLERLQLPKLLDRSVSADPSFPTSPFSLSLSSSPTTPDPFDEDPNGPMRYLRQQSAPVPRFTSTLEAQIEEFPKDSASHQRPQIRSRSSEPPSTRALSPNPVPLLTPKPYFQPRLSADEKWSSKADGLLRVNGEVGNDGSSIKPNCKERESPPQFQASPSTPGNDTADASPIRSPPPRPERGSPVSTKAIDQPGSTEVASQDNQGEKVTEGSPPPTRPTSLPEVCVKIVRSPQTSSNPKSRWEFFALPGKPLCLWRSPYGATIPVYEFSLIFPSELNESYPLPTSVTSFLTFYELVSVPVLAQARRGDRWSWDPDEERKRQERWQQEQERMLQVHGNP
ncbi:hypothetical protein XENOCAPTIV_002053, partial [Xenoophorus captivus]